ncbi:MAG: alpha/beta hydrolase family protein [Verrucomicrobiaceae bacterium]
MRILVLFLVVSVVLHAQERSYDPGVRKGKVETKLTSFVYGEGREVPLKVYLPQEKSGPVILLSHGLGGSREVGTYLGNHWAGRGFVVVAMQHAGSDEAVWKEVPPAQRMKAMAKAANGSSFVDRNGDVSATLDQLETWAVDKAHFLHGRMNLEKVGIGGHSFGAKTTQALCGQRYGVAGARFADERIDAGLALSPSIPRMGDAKKAFGGIQMPMMLMTGTKDEGHLSSATPETRQLVYPALPAGSKYELVLKDAEHMAFSDRTISGKEQRNPNHHRVILALSTAFWEAYLKESQPAREWLDGKKPDAILEEGDVWHRK